MGRSEPLVDTFRAALELGEFRANDLATALSITPQNANNRLKRLVEAGALRRRQASVSNRGGKEFVYSVIQAPTGQPTQSRR
jgi:predicted transcriptional regulator